MKFTLVFLMISLISISNCAARKNSDASNLDAPGQTGDKFERHSCKVSRITSDAPRFSPIGSSVLVFEKRLQEIEICFDATCFDGNDDKYEVSEESIATFGQGTHRVYWIRNNKTEQLYRLEIGDESGRAAPFKGVFSLGTRQSLKIGAQLTCSK